MAATTPRRWDAVSADAAGEVPALAARIRALRGYPIVLNAWASWCTPCQAEFHLFATAAPLYGRHVAFVGADTNDSAGNAAAFLRQHPVSYPSYQANSSDLSSIAAVGNLPTTIFISPRGRSGTCTSASTTASPRWTATSPLTCSAAETAGRSLVRRKALRVGRTCPSAIGRARVGYVAGSMLALRPRPCEDGAVVRLRDR